MARIDRQPGLARAEPALFSRRPRHGRAAAVAAFGGWPAGDTPRIPQPIKRHVRLGQAKLFALIEENRSAKAEQQRQEQRRGLLARGADGLSPARSDASYIVVGKCPAWPAVLRPLAPLRQDQRHS